MIGIVIGCDVVMDDHGGTCGRSHYSGRADTAAAIAEARADGWYELDNAGRWSCGTHGLRRRNTSTFQRPRKT